MEVVDSSEEATLPTANINVEAVNAAVDAAAMRAQNQNVKSHHRELARRLVSVLRYSEDPSHIDQLLARINEQQLAAAIRASEGRLELDGDGQLRARPKGARRRP